MFPKYPYLDLSDRNLDFLTKAIREMENEVKNFVSLNAVKYANPIQWSINRQYEKNTIVIDPLTGTAFISVQPVPNGVSLTRTQYWTPVFDLSQFVTKAASNFANSYERDITTTATMSTGAGDWVVWDSTLYVALTSIHAGDAYIVNGNIKRMTVEDFYDLLMEAIRALDDRIDNEIENRQDADSALGGRIDDELRDRQDADSALGGRIDDELRDRQDADSALSEKIGSLSELTTVDKTSLVNAINEVNATGGGAIQRLNNLKIFNVMEYGAIGDGVNDDTIACKSAIAACKANGGGVVYFPRTTAGFIVSDTLIIDGNIFVKGDGLSLITFSSSVLFTCTGLYGGVEDIHAISSNNGTMILGDCTGATLYRWRFNHLVAEACAHTFNQSIVALSAFGGSYMFECEFNDILSFRCKGDIFVSSRSRGFLQFTDINMDCTYSTELFPHVGITCYDFVGVHLTDCNLYGPTVDWVDTPTYTSGQWAILLNGGGTSATVFITRCMNDTTFGNGIYIGNCSFVHILGVKSFNTWGRGILLDHVEHVDGVNFYLNGAKGTTDASSDDNSGLVLANCNYVDITNVEAYNFKGFGISEYNCNSVHINNVQLYSIDTIAYRELDDNNGGIKGNILGNATFHSNAINIVQESSNAVSYNYCISGTMNDRTVGAFTT